MECQQRDKSRLLIDVTCCLQMPVLCADLPEIAPPVAAVANGMWNEGFTAPAVHAGDHITEEHVHRALAEVGIRKGLAQLQAATPEEVASGVQRATQVDLVFHTGMLTGGVEGGPGAQQLLLQQLQQSMGQLQQQFQQSQEQVLTMLTESMIESAKARNAHASEAHHALVPVRNAAGQVPPEELHPPKTMGELMNLRGRRLDLLLGHYGEDTAGTLAARRRRLARCLGVLESKLPPE